MPCLILPLSFCSAAQKVTGATIWQKQILDKTQKADKSEKLFVSQGTVPLEVLKYHSDMKILISSSYQATTTHLLLFPEGIRTFCSYIEETKGDLMYSLLMYSPEHLPSQLTIVSEHWKAMYSRCFWINHVHSSNGPPISSLLISHNVQISLETRPLGKSQTCRCAFSTTEGHCGIILCSCVLYWAICVFSDTELHPWSVHTDYHSRKCPIHVRFYFLQ